MSRLPSLHGKKSRRNSHPSGQRTRDARTRHLAYEALEDRRLLALIPPALSSLPGAPVTLHIDFDGTPAFVFANGIIASGPAMGNSDPIPAFTIDNDATNFSQTELDGMTAIWQHVAEKFSPFNVNVTTIAPPNYNDAVAIQLIVGGSDNDWYNRNVGGVAPYEGFTTSASNSGFAFSADAIDAGSATLNNGDRHFIAETIAHEAGHLFGLQHQSNIDAGSNVTDEYADGDGLTAPIMGGSSNNSGKRGTWYIGPASADNTNDGVSNPVYLGIQDDLARLTRPGNIIAYRPDDFGSNFAGSGALYVDSQTGAVFGAGIIETSEDQDAFSFVAIGPVLQFTVNNAALGGMLSPLVDLIPVSGNAPAVSVSWNNTSATLTTTNAVPGQTYVLRVRQLNVTYGSLGQYTITGNAGSFASLAGGVLTVAGYNTNNVLALSYISFTDNIVVQNDVFGGSAIQQFPRSQVSSIVVNVGNGDDRINTGGFLSVLSIPVTVNAGGGADRLELEGTTGGDFQGITDATHAYNNATAITFSSVETIVMSGFDGADTFDVSALPASISLDILGDNDNDVINLAPSNPTGVNVINGPINIEGNLGDDTLNIGSGNVDAINANITYNGNGTGGSGSSNDKVIYHDTSQLNDAVYDVGGGFVTRTGLLPLRTLTYFNVQEITVDCGGGFDTVIVRNGVTAFVRAFGNGGADTFIRGDGLLVAQSTLLFDGGPGDDTVTFDDHNNPTGLFWDVNPTQVVFGGAVVFTTTGFEAVTVLAGLGNDVITLVNTIAKGITVSAGGGNDTIELFNVSNFRDFVGQNGEPAFHFAMDLDGGLGYDTLAVNGTTSIDRSYLIRPDNVMALEGAPLGLDFDYRDFQDMNFLGGSFSDEYRVFGTPPAILAGTGQIEIVGNGAQDSLVLYPRDAQGQPTINCDVTFQGGAEVDTVLVDASVSPIGLHYQMAGGTLTGMGPGSVIVNGNEQLTFNAGSGNDIWTTVLGPLSNPPTTINAGGGSNTFNLDASLTPIAWTINGGPNLDTLNLIDSNNPSPSTSWNINATSITRTRSDGATVPKVYTHSALERINVSGGASVDLFYVDAVAPGQMLTLNAGAGLDGMLLGSQATNNLDSIQGAVVFNGQSGGGNLAVVDTADTTGDIVHQTATTLGAFAGDTLFAPGGSLTFSDLVNFGAFAGITLNLGSGADTVFAEPLAVARATVNGGNPASAPGDNFRLSLAGVTSPVFTPNGAGAGTYTFGNAAAINYTGFEAASAYIPGDYSGNGVVGTEDYNIWRGSFGMAVAPGTLGDGNGDGVVDTADYVVWRKNLGAMTPGSGATLATAESNSESSIADAALASAAGITEPVIAPRQSVSLSTPSTASFTAFGEARPGVSSDLRPPFARRATAPKDYHRPSNHIVDLAYQDLDAKRSSLTDDDLTAVARGLRDRGQPNDRFDHGNEIDSGIYVRVALPQLNT